MSQDNDAIKQSVRPSVFISHTHVDKPFVRRVGADLAALGARIWIDEAELSIGDTLLTKISAAIDEMDFLAVVLSPAAVESAWVHNELEQAMTTQLASRRVRVLPLLHIECDLPGFLRGKLYADFTRPFSYDESLQRVAKAIGLSGGIAGTLFDPYAAEFGRLESFYSRPRRWYCIFCGTGPMPGYNDYICTGCAKLRPLMSGSCTLMQCGKCKQMNLALAHYCEWCNERLTLD